MSNFPSPAVSWSDVARACRRVCVLRERGLNEEAERLRSGELMTLLATVRTPSDTDTGITERLNTIFAAEAERVANAAVLAEMLVPMISDRLHVPATPAPDYIAPPAAVALPAPVAPKPAPRRPTSIADFIDDMIAQEAPPARPGPNSERRAS